MDLPSYFELNGLIVSSHSCVRVYWSISLSGTSLVVLLLRRPQAHRCRPICNMRLEQISDFSGFYIFVPYWKEYS